MDTNYVRVEQDGERATVYAAGGIDFALAFDGRDTDGFARRTWVLNDEPSPYIVRLALLAREFAYPHLPALDAETVPS